MAYTNDSDHHTDNTVCRVKIEDSADNYSVRPTKLRPMGGCGNNMTTSTPHAKSHSIPTSTSTSITTATSVSPLLGYHKYDGGFLPPGGGGGSTGSLQETPMMTPPVNGLTGDEPSDWRGDLGGSADTPRSGATYTVGLNDSEMLASPIYQAAPLGDPASWPSLFAGPVGPGGLSGASGAAGSGAPSAAAVMAAMPAGYAGPIPPKMAVPPSVANAGSRVPRTESAGIEFEPLVFPESAGGGPLLAAGGGAGAGGPGARTNASSSSSSSSSTGSTAGDLPDTRRGGAGGSSDKRASAPTTRKELTGEEKRMQKRARNTLAARRSRARKMERMAELEHRCSVLTTKNQELEIEILRLRLLLAQGKDLQTPQSFRDLMMTPGANNQPPQ